MVVPPGAGAMVDDKVTGLMISSKQIVILLVNHQLLDQFRILEISKIHQLLVAD